MGARASGILPLLPGGAAAESQPGLLHHPFHTPRPRAAEAAREPHCVSPRASRGGVLADSAPCRAGPRASFPSAQPTLGPLAIVTQASLSLLHQDRGAEWTPWAWPLSAQQRRTEALRSRWPGKPPSPSPAWAHLFSSFGKQSRTTRTLFVQLDVYTVLCPQSQYLRWDELFS